MEELKKCKICGKSNFRFLFEGRDKNFNIPGKFKLMKCMTCDLIFMNPQPSQKDLEKHYPKEYYSFNKIDIKGKSGKTRLKLFLYDIYFNPKNKGKKIFSNIFFSPFKPYLRGTKIIPKQKLLDIGCGSGQFLYEMKQFGMEVYGNEPGEFDQKTAKKEGLNIVKKELIKAKFPSQSFDVITINHVLEHVNNPSQTIREIYKILKKGGVLIIGVPNHRSLAYFLFKKNWLALDIPRHLYDFSDRTLLKKLKKEKFKIDKIRYNSRPNQFSVSLRYLLKINPKNKIIKILDIFFLPLTYTVNFLKLGDQIEIYCKK